MLSPPLFFKWYVSLRFIYHVLYAFLFFPIRATCPAHLILPDLMRWIIFDEKYNLWISTNTLKLSPISFQVLALITQIFLSTLPSTLSFNSYKYTWQQSTRGPVFSLSKVHTL
jgi:hypothetical protein